jgi:hypothetical protein
LWWEKAAFHGARVADGLGQSSPHPCKARGMKLPALTAPVLRIFQPAFSTPTPSRFRVLWLGAIVTTGRRTLPQASGPCVIMPTVMSPPPHRVCSPRRGSAWELARRWLTLRRTAVVPTGPVVWAGDETGAERPGLPVFGTGRHRAGGRSSHR